MHAIDGYLAFRLAQGWQGIRVFGPLMMAGVMASLAAVAIGQVAIVRRDPSYQSFMALAAGVSVVLVIAAIWRAYRRPR